MNSKMFVTFLEGVRSMVNQKFLMLGDNCTIHTSKFTTAKAKNLGLEMAFNLPDTPVLNSIEQIFSQLKTYYRQLRL